MNAQARGTRGRHLSTDARIRDLLSHAAFAGFGQLILPWDDRAFDEDMRLSDIGALLPYHSQVNPGDVMTALNRLIDAANTGKTVYYDFYTAAQKQQQPARAKTGLFFFRGTPGARTAATIGSHGVAHFGGNDLPRPAALVMA